jgi:sarcosine oxidase
MEHYDVIVVGGGVMGCAATYQLAKRGRRVLLLEQFAINHDRGSSHGHSRIIRLAYTAPVYVQLAQAAYPLWRTLEAEADTELLLQTGGLDFALPGTPSFEATCASLVTLDIAFEQLDHAALAARFPQFQLPDGMIGLYQPSGGLLNADRCVATLASEARRHGATICENTAAQQIIPAGAGVEVRTAAETYQADRLIMTVGSWARPQLRQLGLDLPLRVSKEQVAYFAPLEPALFEPTRFPVFIHHIEQRWSFYGFPIFGLPGIKIGRHMSGAAIEPASDDRDPVPERLAELRAYVAQFFPQAAGEVIFTQTCRYTSTPDEDFIIDQHPEYPQIVIGSPCSGHGFKFGVLIGTILADLAEHGTTDQPIVPFNIGRFA